MRSRTVCTAIFVLASLGILSDTSLAQTSCNLPLPCKNSVISDDTAFAIINSGNGRAGLFRNNNTSNNTPALEGRTISTEDNAAGVVGRLNSTSAGDHSAGVLGINKGVGGGASPPLRIGFWGLADADGATGVFGQSRAGTGVSGVSDDGVAVFGETTDATGGIGVWGKSNARAIVGTQGDTSCAGTYAVGGCATTGDGTFGRADQGIGVFGNSNARGVVGTQGSTSCPGTYGVGGRASNGDGVVGRSSIGRAGFFDGNVVITGSLSKGSGAFKIDHPGDPENKYLYHSFVESSDMLSLYTGNVVLNEHGAATVVLPEWFEALNRDFRYQLTAIGAPGPNLHIAEQIAQNRFKIAGGQPQMKVSWQVTGVRHDPYAERNRIPVEELKPEGERGKYLHPPSDPASTSVSRLSQAEPPAAGQLSVSREGGR